MKCPKCNKEMFCDYDGTYAYEDYDQYVSWICKSCECSYHQEIITTYGKLEELQKLM